MGTSYFLKRILFESEGKLVELISVNKEIINGEMVDVEVLASSIKETPLSKWTEKELLEVKSGEEIKKYIPEDYAFNIVQRIKKSQL